VRSGLFPYKRTVRAVREPFPTMKKFTQLYECPVCLAEHTLEVIPYQAARNMSGRVEDAVPESGGYTEPDTCPACNEPINFEEVIADV
jgi:uncharacterized CHY-type Zn-finger protein